MLNSEFDGIAGDDTDFYPAAAPRSIASTTLIYANVNNGVYRCGFAKSQAAYEAAYDALFATLDELEARLARQRYLLGHRITEADWRLFPTLVRFDVAYFSLFRCNRAAHRRLPQPLELHARALSAAGHRRDGEGALLRGQLLVDRAGSNPIGIIPKEPRSTTRRRTIAPGWRRSWVPWSPSTCPRLRMATNHRLGWGMRRMRASADAPSRGTAARSPLEA